MGKHEKLDFEVEAAMSLKPGERVVFVHKDLPSALMPELEAYRIATSQLPTEPAIVCKVHKDGTIDLQRFATREERLADGRTATGPVHERVPLGKDFKTSNTFRVIM
jgi:hypothetical protein